MKTTILILALISAFAFSSCTKQNSNITDSTKTETVKDISNESDQPLCVKYKVFENGREIDYWFSCSYQEIQETEETKLINFFYADNTLAYSFDIIYVMNGSTVYYSPDCD